MRVFHYTKPLSARLILRSRQIKVSPAHALNDPFELSPNVDPKYYQGIAAVALRQPVHMREAFRRFGKQWGYPNYRLFELDAANWIPRIVDNIPSNVAAAQADFAQRFSSHFRLFFTSKVPDSILMWSHYAEQHSGVVLEIDTGFSPFSEVEPLEVVYRPKKADFNFVPGLEGSYATALDAVVRTKAPDWAYEQEVRFRFPITATVDDLLRFDPRAVRAVFYGCRATAAARASIRAELKSADFAHVDVFEFKRSKDTFSLERHPVRPKHD